MGNSDQQHTAPATVRHGRRQRQAGPPASSLPNPAYVRLRNPFPPIALLSDDEVEAVHDTSLRLLEETGMRVLHEDARAVFRKAGADVDETGMMIRLDRGLVMAMLAKAPPRVFLDCRNPSRNEEMGGNALCFATVGGPPNVNDLDRGKRPGTMRDFVDLVRLTQSYDVVQVISSIIEPLDVEPPLRHLETTRTQLVESDKFPFIYARGRRVTAQSFELMRIGRGLSEDEFRRRCCCFTVINTNSPLQLDRPMSRGIIDFAEAGQLLVITPFTLAGAMAPVSLAGALVLQNAEALAGIALAQMVRPGAPVLYGGFTSNVDMKSGAPAFGTPEYTKAAFATGQLARRYNLPWRSSSTNASNAPDAQAAYESQMSLWGAVLGGANLVIHGAGWLEGGLTASYEKFIIDIEMLQMFAELFRPLTVDRAELALEAIQAVGPAGHFFGAAHTLERYKDAFYAPLVSDWRNFGSWTEAGSEDAARRANRIWKKTLADFVPPPMEAGLREAIDDYVARRTAEGGAALEE
jgi:trimethylamine--corrinoid protein Co-methyltransferase